MSQVLIAASRIILPVEPRIEDSLVFLNWKYSCLGFASITGLILCSCCWLWLLGKSVIAFDSKLTTGRVVAARNWLTENSAILEVANSNKCLVGV